MLELKKQVIHAFITSKLDYCNSLFYGLPSSLLGRLQGIQNVAARILTGSKKFDHITPVLRSLHWLPVEQRIKFKMLLLVYKSINSMAPSYLQDLFKPYVPCRTLRSSQLCLLNVPFTKSQVKHNRAISVAGLMLRNSLPSDLRVISSLDEFKRKLKTHLFMEYFNSN